MTTYLTTIGTEIFPRVISYNQISGCGPVGRALDLGSRRREFESPHSDQKRLILEQNQSLLNLFDASVEEIENMVSCRDLLKALRSIKAHCLILCLLHINF